MPTRRKFLRNTGLLVAAGLTAPQLGKSFFQSAAMPPAGLQLFTFFNVIDDDVKGTLEKVASIGYKKIESAFSRKGGYYGMKPKEFAAALQGMGLSWKAHHVIGAPFKLPPGSKPPAGPDGKPISIPPMRNLKDNMQALVDEAAEGGVEYLVCASTPITTLDEVKSSTEVLSKTGEACKKAGIKFAYHNHHMEFFPVEGQVPYDMFLSQTSADTVKMELDLAWAVKGGQDPVAIFQKNPGRFPLWHVKDLDTKKESVLPVGNGIIDFKRIFDAAATSGLEHYFIEHDMPADPFGSIAQSMQHLRKILNG